MPSSPESTYRVTHAAISDVGMRRANNQDAVAVVVDESSSDRQHGHFFMVADGMGAHAAGELASKLAVESVPHTYRKLRAESPPAALRQAVQNANERIFDKGSSSPEFHGMGTTCSCLVLLPGAALVAHVGDSRVYRARGATLEQLTFDHSLVWEMAAASSLTDDKVPACIPKNVITRSLGPHEAVNVDLEGPFPMQAGDVFLLCSDGLSGVVDDVEIGALIGAMAPQDAAQTLVDLANLRGGPDNISVVVVKVEEEAKEGSDATGDEDKKPRIGRVHVLSWLGMLVSLAAVIGFGAYRHGLGALLAAAGFGASLVISVMQHLTPPAAAPAPLLGGPYGNGPYRRYDCKLGESASETVMTVVEELARLDTESSGEPVPEELHVPEAIDWAPFHECRQQALDARGAGDHRESLRRASGAIRTLMRQVRQENGQG